MKEEQLKKANERKIKYRKKLKEKGYVVREHKYKLEDHPKVVQFVKELDTCTKDGIRTL